MLTTGVFWQLTLDANAPGPHPTGRDNALTVAERVAMVDAEVERLVALGATEINRERSDDPDDPSYFVTLQNPEGNEHCVS